ncbi:hypothetical protein [Coprococcus sp. RTP21204st1_G4_RTP21204_210225]
MLRPHAVADLRQDLSTNLKELLAKVLANPEMRALLNSLAKTMK